MLGVAPTDPAQHRAPGLPASPSPGFNPAPIPAPGALPLSRACLTCDSSSAVGSGGSLTPHPIRRNNRNGHKRKQSFKIYVITQSGKVSQMTPPPLPCHINPLATTSWSGLASRSSLAALAYMGWLKGSRPSPPRVLFF